MVDNTLALMVRPVDVVGSYEKGNALRLQNQEMQLKQQALRQEQQKQRTLADIMPQAIQGDENALARLGAIDPKAFNSIVTGIGKMDKNQRERAKFEITQAAALLQPIMQAPPEQRQALYEQQLQRAAQMGLNLNNVPAQYSDAWAGQTMALANVATSAFRDAERLEMQQQNSAFSQDMAQKRFAFDQGNEAFDRNVAQQNLGMRRRGLDLQEQRMNDPSDLSIRLPDGTVIQRGGEGISADKKTREELTQSNAGLLRAFKLIDRDLLESSARATGPLPVMLNVLNSTIGAVIPGEVAPRTRESMDAIKRFNNTMTRLLKFDSQLNNEERKRIESLLPQVNSFFKDPDGEVEKLRDLREYIPTLMQINQDVLTDGIRVPTEEESAIIPLNSEARRFRDRQQAAPNANAARQQLLNQGFSQQEVEEFLRSEGLN